MKFLARGKRKQPAEDPGEGLPVEEQAPIADATEVAKARLVAKLAGGALVACLCLAPVGAFAGGWAAWQTLTRRPAAAAAAQLDQAGDRTIVGAFAVDVVMAWLSATRDRSDALAVLVPGIQPDRLPVQAFKARDVVVADVRAAGSGVWSVTVAVTVTDAKKLTVRRHFQVPVQLSESGTVVALTLPTPVSPPPIGVPGTSGFRTVVQPGADGGTVQQFLDAYLTGRGEVARYVTPGVDVQPLMPAPFRLVQLGEVRAMEELPAGAPVDGVQLHVLAVATVSVTDKQTTTVTYLLTLTARAGRWEISSIDAAPTAAPSTPVSRKSPTPGPTPTR